MINTAAIQAMLRPGLADIFGDYPSMPAEWTQLYSKHTSDKATEIDLEIKLLGLASIKAEGASIAYDTMGQRYTTNYIHRYVGIGFVITRQAMKDNLYKSSFPLQAKALKDSMAQTKETLGASVFNNGFDTNFPIGDGRALFSLTHTIEGGTLANTFAVQADLNETSLSDAITGVGRFLDAAGLKKPAKPKKLALPLEMRWAAERLLGSQKDPTSNHNAINVVYKSVDYCINHWFTDTNSWYLLTDAPSGFKYYEREGYETDVYRDFDTHNLKAQAIERYSFGVTNFRAAWGSQGAV
jgi:hypothetical protein